MEIVRTIKTDNGWEFVVKLANFSYKVSLKKEYYDKLTGGKATPVKLVEASFDFLLAREPASAILTEFDLEVISRYYPEYESEITKQLDLLD